MKQNHSTELSGHSFRNICNRNDPADPQDPQIDFWSDFPEFAIRDQKTNSVHLMCFFSFVGVGVLRGDSKVFIFQNAPSIFQDLKDSKNDLPKIQRFHAHPTLSNFANILNIRAICFWFNRIYLGFKDFRISEIHQDSTTLFSVSFQSDRGWRSFWIQTISVMFLPVPTLTVRTLGGR